LTNSEKLALIQLLLTNTELDDEGKLERIKEVMDEGGLDE